MQIHRGRWNEASSPAQGRGRSATGFTLVDVLVSISVIGVLVGLMLPSLTNVRETGNRVVCSSNVRQVGLGLAMYCDDSRGFLPTSVFLGDQNSLEGVASNGSSMMVLRLGPDDISAHDASQPWDGLGRLFSADYLLTPKVFYCPSHRGEHPFRTYADAWTGEDNVAEIMSNYHYRGEGPDGVRQIERIDPQTSALVTDGLAQLSDYNHKVGSNVLYADLSVRWFLDSSGSLSNMLRNSNDSGRDGSDYKDIWKTLDSPNGSNDQVK